MENTAAFLYSLGWLRQANQKAHLLLARNSTCTPEVGVGKSMTLMNCRLSSTSIYRLSSWFTAGMVSNATAFSSSSWTWTNRGTCTRSAMMDARLWDILLTKLNEMAIFIWRQREKNLFAVCGFLVFVCSKCKAQVKNETTISTHSIILYPFKSFLC